MRIILLNCWLLSYTKVSYSKIASFRTHCAFNTTSIAAAACQFILQAEQRHIGVLQSTSSCKNFSRQLG